ncbi:hypothetical protein ACFLTH_09425 [Bacteroidota bacterium]
MIKQKQITTSLLTIAIFSLTIITLFSPIISEVIGANNTQQYFNLSLTISNSAPTIQNILAVSATPNEGTTKTVSILFNVTDANGYTDVDPTQAYANVTLSGLTVESQSCEDYSAWTTGNTRGVNCTIIMNYNYEPGKWSISVRAPDSSATDAVSDDGENLTYLPLYAFQLTKSSVSFSASGAGVTDVNASNDPQTLNNTGNGDFAKINITGHDLSNGIDSIGSGNFTVNATTDAKGLSVGDNVQIPVANLSRNTTQDLYIWVDVPSGISNGTYTTNSSTQWLIEAFN